MISRIEFMELFEPFISGRCKKLLTRFSYTSYHFKGSSPFHFKDMSVFVYMDKNDDDFIKFIHNTDGYYYKVYFFRLPEYSQVLDVMDTYLNKDGVIDNVHKNDEKRFILDVMNCLNKCDLGTAYNLK